MLVLFLKHHNYCGTRTNTAPDQSLSYNVLFPEPYQVFLLPKPNQSYLFLKPTNHPTNYSCSLNLRNSYRKRRRNRKQVMWMWSRNDPGLWWWCTRNDTNTVTSDQTAQQQGPSSESVSSFIEPQWRKEQLVCTWFKVGEIKCNNSGPIRNVSCSLQNLS